MWSKCFNIVTCWKISVVVDLVLQWKNVKHRPSSRAQKNWKIATNVILIERFSIFCFLCPANVYIFYNIKKCQKKWEVYLFVSTKHPTRLHQWPYSFFSQAKLLETIPMFDLYFISQSWTRCDCTTCFSTSNLTTGLLQLCADSFTGVNACTTPESSQRCCSFGSWFGNMWSRETSDVWTSLVTNCRENQVQTLPFGIPCSQWSCTVVSDRVGYSGSQHPRTCLSLLSWEARSGCSAFETGLIRAGILHRCTKSVERPNDIRLITDTKLFKKKLKTFLFNSAWHSTIKFCFDWTIMDYVKLATGHCVSGTRKCLINK